MSKMCDTTCLEVMSQNNGWSVILFILQLNSGVV